MKEVYIYGLCGDNDIIRYVGKSHEPEARRKQHIYETKRNLVNKYKNNWVRKLLRNGETLKIVILEKCSELEWPEREKYWIKKYNENGNDLVNVSEGGEGSTYRKYDTPFTVIKNWVQINLPEISSEKKWREYLKDNELPEFIPNRPDSRYKNDGWISWTDFFDNTYLTYNELKEYVQKEGIKTVTEYSNKRLKNMPARPAKFYQNKGWVSFYDLFDKIKKGTR
jgi:hypothetical protein